MCVVGGVVFTFCLRLNRNALPRKGHQRFPLCSLEQMPFKVFCKAYFLCCCNKLLKILWLRATVGSWHHVSGVTQSVIPVSAQLYSLVKFSGGQRSASSFVVHCALQFRSLSVLRASSAVSFSLSLLPHICALTLILGPFSPAAIWPST